MSDQQERDLFKDEMRDWNTASLSAGSDFMLPALAAGAAALGVAFLVRRAVRKRREKQAVRSAKAE